MSGRSGEAATTREQGKAQPREGAYEQRVCWHRTGKHANPLHPPPPAASSRALLRAPEHRDTTRHLPALNTTTLGLDWFVHVFPNVYKGPPAPPCFKEQGPTAGLFQNHLSVLCGGGGGFSVPRNPRRETTPHASPLVYIRCSRVSCRRCTAQVSSWSSAETRALPRVIGAPTLPSYNRLLLSCCIQTAAGADGSL